MDWLDEVEVDSLKNKIDVLTKRLDTFEELLKDISYRVSDLENETAEPSHSEGWYHT